MKETLADFLARGGTIERCPPRGRWRESIFVPSETVGYEANRHYLRAPKSEGARRNASRGYFGAGRRHA